MTKQQEEMNKRFDVWINHMVIQGAPIEWVSKLKSFLQSEIDMAVAENNQRIVEMIEGMKTEEGQTEECEDVLAMNYLIGENKGYNDCLQEILTKLNKLKDK